MHFGAPSGIVVIEGWGWACSLQCYGFQFSAFMVRSKPSGESKW